jgi:branched-chain amino acid aminotransferase
MSTMEDRDGFIWMDGEWLDWRKAKVHVLTHPIMQCMGQNMHFRFTPT